MDTWRSVKEDRRFAKVCVALAGAILLGNAQAAIGQAATKRAAHNSRAERGEFGGELAWLAERYSPPVAPGESNYYFQMWDGPTIRALTTSSGLTNNHALFINSHGKGIVRGLTARYAYFPHQALLDPSKNAPCYSAGDLARMIGPANVGQIQNILIAGCDTDRAFRAAELRKYFVNATNITHAAPGQFGYQPMFLQAVLNLSAAIQPLYETREKSASGRIEYFMGAEPARHATQLSPYVADLFRRGENDPYRTQLAGRELLDAGVAQMSASESAIAELAIALR